MNRRGFLGACIALAAAPAIVRASNLMPVRAARSPWVGGIDLAGGADATLLRVIREAELEMQRVAGMPRYLVIHPSWVPTLKALDIRPGKVFWESDPVRKLVVVDRLPLTPL